MTLKLKEKSEKELEKALSEERESLRKFRFNISGASAKNGKEGKDHRKNIARILTEINSRRTKK